MFWRVIRFSQSLLIKCLSDLKKIYAFTEISRIMFDKISGYGDLAKWTSSINHDNPASSPKIKASPLNDDLDCSEPFVFLVEFPTAMIDFLKSNLFSPPQLLQPCSNPYLPHTTASCFYDCSCEVYSQYSRHDKLIMKFLCLKLLHWFPMSLSENAKPSQGPHRPTWSVPCLLPPLPLSSFLTSVQLPGLPHHSLPPEFSLRLLHWLCVCLEQSHPKYPHAWFLHLCKPLLQHHFNKHYPGHIFKNCNPSPSVALSQITTHLAT